MDDKRMFKNALDSLTDLGKAVEQLLGEDKETSMKMALLMMGMATMGDGSGPEIPDEKRMLAAGTYTLMITFGTIIGNNHKTVAKLKQELATLTARVAHLEGAENGS